MTFTCIRRIQILIILKYFIANYRPEFKYFLKLLNLTKKEIELFSTYKESRTKTSFKQYLLSYASKPNINYDCLIFQNAL